MTMREPPPFVHEPGLGMQRLGRAGRLQVAEVGEERLIALRQAGQIPRPAHHRVLAADEAEGRGERHGAAGQAEFLDHVQRLTLPAEVRRDPYAGLGGPESRPGQPASEPVPQITLGLRYRDEQQEPPAVPGPLGAAELVEDRKSTRLNSSHLVISY